MADNKVKISELALATALDGTESIPMLKDGGNPRATLNMLREFFRDSSLVPFSGIDTTENPTISTKPLTGYIDMGTYYMASVGTFARKYLNIPNRYYYSYAYTGNVDFMREGKVRTDRVFFNVDDKCLYIYNEGLVDLFDTVRINAMTEEEFENLTNPIEGAFYATYEE